MTAATTVLMNPSRCDGASPAETTTPKRGPRRSSTDHAAQAVQPFQRKRPAVAPQDASKAIPGGTKTTNAPAAWPASGPVKPRMSVDPTSDPGGRNGTINAAAAVHWADPNGPPVSLLCPELRMQPSPQAAAAQRQTADAPAPAQAPRTTPGDPLSRRWPRTGPAATANPPAAHGPHLADRGTTAPASTTEPVASPTADPARQPGVGGLQRSQ